MKSLMAKREDELTGLLSRTASEPLILPVNYDAEQALLGALLINNRSYDRVVDILKPTDFANSAHARIYAAIGFLIDKGSVANPVTLKAYFDRDGALSTVGGAGYLIRLVEGAITVIAAEDYARAIADLSRRRAVIAACQQAIEDAAAIDLERTADDILSDFDRTILVVSDRSGGRATTIDAAADVAIAAAEETYKADGRITGVTTGLIDLDRRLGGLHNSDLVIIAARPTMGKSALAMNIADAAARAGHRGLFFSLEMSSDQLAARQLAAISGVSSDKQRAGPLSRDEMQQLIAAKERLHQLPLTIDDDPMVTVTQIRARCRKHKRRHGLGLVIIDYLQLMLPDKAKPENRVQEVSAISRGLKALAKDLNVPVLALSQLNRSVESREDNHPMLADLRDSGSIEQDADVVMFIYREEVYLSRDEPREKAAESPEKFGERYANWQAHMDRCRGIAEILIEKNRHGATRNIRVKFDAERTRFDNLAWAQ